MDMNALSRFKNALNGGGVVGIFMKTGDPAFVEAAGYAGLDYAILDMEHGPASVESMQNNVRAAEVAGIIPIVRVAGLSESHIGKALDIGAAGVQIPQITCAEEARRAVRYAKFHPQGERGVCRFVRAARYAGMSGGDYVAAANGNLVIVQLEGQTALGNVDAILAVEGVDVVFVGPYDLSQSLGLTGQTTHPKVVEQMRFIVDKAKRAGKAAGTFTDSAETLSMWRAAGVAYISYSVDVSIFREACRGVREGYDKLGRNTSVASRP